MEILVKSLNIVNSFARLKRALTEDEFDLYQASLKFTATSLRLLEIEAKLQEILEEKELDEYRDFNSDSDAEVA